MLLIKGTIDGKRAGEFKGKDYAVLQFIDRSEDGSLKMIDVNLPDGYEHSDLRQGVEVEIPVRVSAKDGKIYYRCNGTVLKSNKTK